MERATGRPTRVTGPEGMELEDVHLGFDADNACVVYATYTTKPSAYSKELHGIWYARFGYGLDLETSRMQPWPVDMVAHFSGEASRATSTRPSWMTSVSRTCYSAPTAFCWC